MERERNLCSGKYCWPFYSHSVTVSHTRLTSTNLLLLCLIRNILVLQQSCNLISQEQLGSNSRNGIYENEMNLLWSPFSPFMSEFNLRYWTLWNPAIWAVESPLINNSRTWNLGWEGRCHNNSPFRLFFRNTKWEFLEENPLIAQMREKWIFCKN